MSNQLAVLFPGIGYHIDKPLLYYSAKLARARGCDLLAVQYPALPTGLRGHAEKIEQAVQTALSAAEEQLTAIDWTAYDRVFFLSKSIGTAIAARYAVQHNIHPRQVYYTPIEQALTLSRPDRHRLSRHRRSVGGHRDDHERLPEGRHSALSDRKRQPLNGNRRYLARYFYSARYYG